MALWIGLAYIAIVFGAVVWSLLFPDPSLRAEDSEVSVIGENTVE